MAAQAQQRAMQALQQKATLGRQMSQDDYEKKKAAAEAADLIAQRNAANSMTAQQENNQWQNQGFQNDLSKAQGQAGLIGQSVGNAEKVGAVNQAGINGQGQLAGSLVGQGAKLFGSGSGGSTTPPATSAPPLVNADGSSAGGGSDPNQWAQWTSASPPSQAPEDTGIKLDDLDF